MIDVGRVCVKIAGRDARKRCVIVEKLDKTFVLIDGETRRRKCSIAHLEPLNQTLDIKSGADREAVKAAFKGMGIELVDTKAKKATERPKKVRKGKDAAKAEKKAPAKKGTKKAAKPKAKEAKADAKDAAAKKE